MTGSGVHPALPALILGAAARDASAVAATSPSARPRGRQHRGQRLRRGSARLPRPEGGGCGPPARGWRKDPAQAHTPT